MEINIFLPINVKLGWLNNASGLHFVGFETISSGTGPSFPLAGGFCRQYANSKKNLLLVRHVKQANKLLL
jgi:hypothetical protein